jgi:hypothetical protein
MDYKGASARTVSSPEYTGLVAEIVFGYKPRSWGLCVGPESFAQAVSDRNRYVQVATNAFFFARPPM